MLSIKGLEPIAKALSEVVKDHVSRAFRTLAGRIDGIESQLKALPAPRDGVDGAPGVDGKDGAPGKDGQDGSPGSAGTPGTDGAPGRDGADGKSLTLSDVQPILNAAVAEMMVGATKTLAEAVAALPAPKDGRDGLDGKSVTPEDLAPMLDGFVAKWALEFERRAQDTLQKAIDRVPPPKDGRDGVDGKDGRDGVGFDDLAVEFDGEKTVTFRLERGEVSKEFSLVLPVVVDRGIYADGRAYTAGDAVTWGGSFWVAQKDTSAKPDSPDSGWRLAVKKGRDGKDGRNGIDKTAGVAL